MRKETPLMLAGSAKTLKTVDQVRAQMASGDLAGAMKRIKAALKRKPDHPVWLMCAGRCARESQQWAQAEAFFLRLTTLAPTEFEAWFQLAQVRQAQGHHAPAATAFLQALALQPQHAHTHYLMAGLLKQLGQAQQAQTAYLQALRYQTDHPHASADLGLLWQEQGRYDAAEPCYHLAASLAPHNPVVAYNHGLVLQHLQRFAEAETSYRRALALRPGFQEAASNLGALLLAMDRPGEAEQMLLALTEAQPHMASAHINLGNLRQDQGHLAEAEAAFRRALALEPNNENGHYNLANVLVRAHRFDEAVPQFRRALAVASNAAPLVAWNFSLLMLSLGRYEEAWALHEARYAPHWPANHVRATQPPALDCPAWQGESLQGRRILVVQEQGGGDQIQFVRYLSLLLARNPAQVTLSCPAPLLPLFRQFESDRVSVRCVVSLAELPAHDCWVLMMSLPLHLGTDCLARIPTAMPYLRAEPALVQAWRQQLPQAKRRIGLVWKGSAGHRNDKHRSLPHLSVLAPLWQAAGCRSDHDPELAPELAPEISFVSLQKGQAEDEALSPPALQPLVHLGSQLQHFADSAAVVAQLDLLICVDTAAAHLAGALGVPCWVLLPHVGTDWRWLHGREDSPWYPGTLRLFRQGEGESWGEVIARVATALAELVAMDTPKLLQAVPVERTG